eukprot:CAMPEP_0172314366 /NCGR_PEP_ID=MMETSP1058-20130122/22356_1 /TAXON_ID=83371 /ORGANISM="Detonula confervacea, Strain CCMP 353" /LENGTH=237 /DNA_ID=CAMNT_0013028217 /DNA_START=40 /DNA_END=756 /DNA_ORIENTATION=+
MVSTATSRASLTILGVACLLSQCTPFTPVFVQRQKHQTHFSPSVLAAAAASPPPSNVIDTSSQESCCQLRRSFLTGSFAAALGIAVCVDRPNAVVAADENLDSILGQIKEATEQLESIPDLIKTEKWDAARAVLAKPPLSTMWTSRGQNDLLKKYAGTIGDELPDGDEIAALEFREEAISHLRYLDMAVYNNVFNPIATEGKSGATKELVRSYYEDPTNEWEASKSAMDGLIGLAPP